MGMEAEHEWQRENWRPAVRLREGRAHEEKAASYELPIPWGSPVTIDAAPDRPKWIAAARDPLLAGDYRDGFVLFPGHMPVRITRAYEVREPDGNRSAVTVFNVRPDGARVD